MYTFGCRNFLYIELAASKVAKKKIKQNNRPNVPQYFRNIGMIEAIIWKLGFAYRQTENCT